MIFFLKLLLQMLLRINNISLIFKILFNKILNNKMNKNNYNKQVFQ